MIHIRTAVIVLATSMACPFAHAANIRYVVEPYTLSQGYAVEGGFIETDGTLGTLNSAATIVDYEVSVSGPIPFTFTPANPSARTTVDNVVATEHALLLPTGEVSQLQILNFDNGGQVPSCTTCGMFLIYGFSSNGAVDIIFDGFDADPGFLVMAGMSFPQPLSIAEVPEPSTIMLSLLGLGVVVCSRRKSRSAPVLFDSPAASV